MTPDQQVDSLAGELSAERERLRECERRLERAQSALSTRDFELASVRRELDRNEELLDGWRVTVREQEAELIEAEAQLVAAELRAERFEDALTSIRSGRAYKLMRIVWRLRKRVRRHG
jgi:chromosome segregation ATPase